MEAHLAQHGELRRSFHRTLGAVKTYGLAAGGEIDPPSAWNKAAVSA